MTTTAPKYQYSLFVGSGGQIVVRSDVLSEFKEGVKEMVELSGELAGASTALINAFGVSSGSVASGSGTNSASGAPRKSYSRSVKPGGAPSGDVPMCECGIIMNDVRGKVYQKGPKQGQPYGNSFYPSRDCKSGCKPV